MVIDFKNKTIQVPRGTSVATLMDFMKTIIHEDVNNFTILAEKETNFLDLTKPTLYPPYVSSPNVPINPLSNPFKVTCGTTTEGTVSSLPNSTFTTTSTN